MHRTKCHPTRRKPHKRNARQVSKPNAHPSTRTVTYYRTPNGSNHITLLDVLSALAVVAVIVAFFWALGASYQFGYNAGLEWAAS